MCVCYCARELCCSCILLTTSLPFPHLHCCLNLISQFLNSLLGIEDRWFLELELDNFLDTSVYHRAVFLPTDDRVELLYLMLPQNDLYSKTRRPRDATAANCVLPLAARHDLTLPRQNRQLVSLLHSPTPHYPLWCDQCHRLPRPLLALMLADVQPMLLSEGPILLARVQHRVLLQGYTHEDPYG